MSYNVIKYIQNYFNAYEIKHKKYIFFKSNNSNLLGKKFNVENKSFFISKEKENSYHKVRTLSNTNNLTVIFTLTLKSKIITKDDSDYFFSVLNS